MLNQCRKLCFKIIKRENSFHVTGCIGVEQIPENIQNIKHEIFPNRGGDLSYHM
jgi:hypothetical protein